MNKLVALLLIVLCCSFGHVKSQTLVKTNINKPDSALGIFVEYALHSDFSYIKLDLYKNNVFHYEDGIHAGDFYFFSNGTWKQKGDTIILNSYLDSENLSITLKYFDSIADKSPRNYNKKILIPMDYNNNLLYDGVIHINNDDMVCHPSLDTCFGGPVEKVDMIKVSFDNGVKSKWVQLNHNDFKQLQIYVDMPADHDHYEPFYNKKYFFVNEGLRAVE